MAAAKAAVSQVGASIDSVLDAAKSAADGANAVVAAIRNVPNVASDATARHDFTDDFCRLKAQRCTAMDWIFILAYCFAIP